MAAQRPITRPKQVGIRDRKAMTGRPATVPNSSVVTRSSDPVFDVSRSAGDAGMTDPDDEDDGFGWPELPPIFQYRAGIARESVGRGVEYILPIDKGRLSVENVYRVDLRAMFQMPYMRVSRLFDDNRMQAVSRLHLRPNAIHSSNRREVTQLIDSFQPNAKDDVQLRRIGSSLSNAPRQALENYCNSSPDNRPLFTPDRMQTRSKIFLPFQTNPTSATSEARAKAQSILQELSINIDLLEDRAMEEEEKRKKEKQDEEEGMNTKKSMSDRKDTCTKLIIPGRVGTRESAGPGVGTPLTRLKNAGIASFEDFSHVGNKFRPKMPSDARSRYLDDETNAKIWDWLTEPEEMSKFDYFMTLCG